jgi:hypothetical protein
MRCIISKTVGMTIQTKGIVYFVITLTNPKKRHMLDSASMPTFSTYKIISQLYECKYIDSLTKFRLSVVSVRKHSQMKPQMS